MKKVLVTGGAGFIGSHLVERLVNKGYGVTVLDNLLQGNKIDRKILKMVNFIKGDVCNLRDVTKACKGADLVFHFAAVLGVDIVADNPVETMETEVIGMRNVVDAALKYKPEKIIYASTSGVYGHSGLKRSVTETIQLDPSTSYAMAKRYNEVYLKALYEEKDLSSVSLRFFNVYGPRQDNRMVIPRFIEQALNNEHITVYGDGMQTRDFTYIDDTIEACMRLANSDPGCEIFNIANEDEKTIKGVAETILKITKSKSKIMYIDAPAKRYDYEVERRYGSSKKLYAAIGYKPSTSLEKGLKLMLKG
jgi:nucleoside-diphosphate-sugar epimerase